MLVTTAVASSLALHPGDARAAERVHPYYEAEGAQDGAERVARRLELADAARAAGDGPRAARHLAMGCMWEAYVEDDASLAGPACRRATAMAEHLGLVDVRAVLALSECNVRAYHAELPAAMDACRRAITLCDGLDPRSPEAAPARRAHHALGFVRALAGDSGQGIALEERAIALSAAASDPGSAAWAHGGLCDILRKANDWDAARPHCEAAWVGVRATHDWYGEMWMTSFDGDRLADLGRRDEALAAYLRSWALAQRPGGASRRVGLRITIPAILISSGRLDEAERWLRELDQEIAAGRYPAFMAPEAAYEWGRVARARGDWARAADRFDAARAVPEHWLRIVALGRLAEARLVLGDAAGARAALEDAVAAIEAERSSMRGPLRAGYQELHAAVYRALAAMWSPIDPARALEVAEAGRARALLDALATADLPGRAATPLTAVAVRESLADDEVLLEYVLADRHPFVLTVTRAGVVATALPGAGDALAERIGFFRQLVAQGADEATLRPAAARLYLDLLAPALQHAPAGARTLVISPDGPLAALPFDALVNEGQPVVDRWDLALVPSASVLAARPARAAPTAAALIVAAQSPTQVVLPRVRDEATAAGRWLAGQVVTLTGDEATTARVRALEPGRFAVVHVASHAVVDETHALRSGLELADGSWRAQDIYAQPIGADLVVLSACRTAVGELAPGEGVMSLSRAFLHAGAGATVATLWDVDDAVGPAFADALYRALATRVPLGAAAARARRALRHAGAPPSAWAAYVLTGAPHAVARVAARPGRTRRPWRFAVAGAAAGLGLLAAALRRDRRGFALAGSGMALATALLLLLAPAPTPRFAVPRSAVAARSAGAPAVVAHAQGRTVVFTASGPATVRWFGANGVPLLAQQAARSPAPAPPGAAWAQIEVQPSEGPAVTSALVAIEGEPPPGR
jgi:CHAT domain-containing protein